MIVIRYFCDLFLITLSPFSEGSFLFCEGLIFNKEAECFGVGSPNGTGVLAVQAVTEFWTKDG